jgi:hypothetical protein
VRKAELTQWGVAEVGVHHFPRQYGHSQFFRMRSLLRTLWQLVALYVKLAPRQPAWPRHRKACERVIS